MQRCPAYSLAGKMIRLEGEVKTKNIEQWAGLWLRADGGDGLSLFLTTWAIGRSVVQHLGKGMQLTLCSLKKRSGSTTELFLWDGV